MRGMKIKTEKTNVINKLAGAHLTPGIRGKFDPLSLSCVLHSRQY